MTPDVSPDDPGIIPDPVPGGTLPVDVYDADSRIAEAARAWQADATDAPAHVYTAALVGIRKDLGLPPVSHYLALEWAKAVKAAAKDLEGKGGGPGPSGGTAASPGSTGSTPTG